MNLIQANVNITLLWYNPCKTAYYGKGQGRTWELRGKGFGGAIDKDGNLYFVYGQELGGGLYGEDADPLFIQIGRNYTLTSYHESTQADINSHFFMKHKRRVANITLLNGRKPRESI